MPTTKIAACRTGTTKVFDVTMASCARFNQDTQLRSFLAYIEPLAMPDQERAFKDAAAKTMGKVAKPDAKRRIAFATIDLLGIYVEGPDLPVAIKRWKQQAMRHCANTEAQPEPFFPNPRNHGEVIANARHAAGQRPF